MIGNVKGNIILDIIICSSWHDFKSPPIMVTHQYKKRGIMQKLTGNLKKHRIMDALIYRISRKTAIFETLRFKAWLFTKKLKYTSNLNPIVIGGCPRSGTTLVRSLIGIHPEIASPKNEYNILMWIKNNDILENIFGFSAEEISTLKTKHKDLACFAENVLKLYMQKEGKQFVALKHPFHIIIIDELFRYFPNMKFIHVIRDGRDASCSLRTHPKRKMVKGEIVPNTTKNPFDWCIRRWVSCINQGKKWRKSDRYIEVKYEDLVNNPVSTMEKIFKFLGLKMIAEDKLLNFYKYEKDEKHLQNIEVGKPIYKKTIGRWKKDMTEKEKEMFKHMAGEMLIEFGYEEDFNW